MFRNGLVLLGFLLCGRWFLGTPFTLYAHETITCTVTCLIIQTLLSNI